MKKISLPEKRYNICKSCEHFFKFSGQCLACLCIMKLKTKLKDAKCPKGKW